MNCKSFVPSTGVERRFAWLSAIPHGSGNERPLSDAICQLMQEAGLETIQDALGNLLVRKPATEGYEDKAPVILQAHLDMVCTQLPESRHNFKTDPLVLLEDEDGWLHADGTTLGADDGYGVAYMMEALLGGDAAHPELECLFTVQEEIGLVGAANFDTNLIRARRMISMDSRGENVATVSTCGGRRITFTLPMKKVDVSGTALRLTVSGLLGGHSAREIHRGRANAVKVLSHALMSMKGAALVSASGGEAANAIPRDAWAIVKAPEDRLESVKAAFEKVRARFAKLHRATDPDFAMTLEEAACSDGPAYDLACFALPVALPDGIRAMDPERSGIAALSDNVGVLRVQDGMLRVQCMIRSASVEYCDLLSEQILSVAGAFGAEARIDSDYPGMEYHPESKMRRLFGEIVREKLDKELIEISAHCGMEIGYFSRSVPGLDIVTFGPIDEGCHSPSERLNLASFNRMYGILKEMLARLD